MPRKPSFDSPEEENLLEIGENGARAAKRTKSRHRLPQWTIRICTHSLVAVISVILTSLVLKYRGQVSRPRPLSQALQNVPWKVEPTRPVMIKDSEFVGGPESVADNAWEKLLNDINIKVTADELSRNGDHQNSVAVSSDGEHLVWLNVFHQLHCLKKLRRINYRDHYHMNDTEAEHHERTIHADHCVEMLRQSVMCNPDLALTTFDWEAKKRKPTLNVRPHERLCVNWDVMMTAITPRVMNDEQMAAIVNPIYEDSNHIEPAR